MAAPIQKSFKDLFAHETFLYIQVLSDSIWLAELDFVSPSLKADKTQL